MPGAITEKTSLFAGVRKHEGYRMGIADGLLDYITSVQYKDLPDEVVQAAKGIMLNTFGAILAGSGAQGVKEIASLSKKWGGKKESTVFLYGTKVPAHEAVFVNATMARAIDFDEFNLKTGIHSGATVLPTALAAAEVAGNASGKDVLAAFVVGAEVMNRMRLVPDVCIGISGWTGEIFGGFGSAITAGKILGLTREEMSHALGLAFSQAAGSAQSIYDGVLATRLQQGFSARAGFLSAILAHNGITGAHDFLEGRAGLYPVYYRGMAYNLSRLLDAIGERYEFLNIATKPYPCCGFLMAPIENVLASIRSNNLDIKNIAEVEVRVNQRMYNTVCDPPKLKYRPKNIADAMFSLPYVIGTAMVRGDVSLEDFTLEKIRDPERLKLADKVKIVMDETIERESRELDLALSLHTLTVETEDGRRFSKKMHYPKGFPQHPMTTDDFITKIQKCTPFAVKTFPSDKIEVLKDLVTHIEDQRDAASLVTLFS
jgi:2-methylcitrate dehydratase PrpD